MCPEPASVIPFESLGPCRVIGLFLARLFAYLVRLETSSVTTAPSDIAHVVVSAEAMVHGLIRTLTAAQLKNAGYKDIARAMRMPDGVRAPARVQIDMQPVPTAALIERLKTTIADFERADALASLLARLIVCALAFIAPETREPLVRARPDAQPMSLPASHFGQALPPWPPPLRMAGITLDGALGSRNHERTRRRKVRQRMLATAPSKIRYLARQSHPLRR